jgi:hypothetical protein
MGFFAVHAAVVFTIVQWLALFTLRPSSLKPNQGHEYVNKPENQCC